MDITIWERWNKKEKRFEHNHIENGTVRDDAPMPNSEMQKASWTGVRWQRKYGVLAKGIVFESEWRNRFLFVKKFKY
jgi:hypothetical protein